jgi:zinc transporter 9
LIKHVSHADRLAGNLHSHSHGEAERPDVEEGLGVRRSASSESKSVSALVGLCVHAFCDGIALGSAMADPTSGTAISSVALLVFLAIMLHKGPSSFGLTTYLITQGMSTAGVQTRLFLFSLAAPLGTVVTYFLLSARLFAYSRVSCLT